MSKRSTELYFALATALVIGAMYIVIVQNSGIPGSSGLLGHGIGILGFVLMLGAEVLYSWRKQQRGARWGKMNTWLQAHIYFGLVGPFLVLLHSAWKLNGVAGATLLLTLLMVATGFLCSYIYTAMPRTADGSLLALREVENQIASITVQLEGWETGKPPAMTTMAERLAVFAESTQEVGALAVLGRSWLHWRYRRRLRRDLNQLDTASRAQIWELSELLDRRYRLVMQARTLTAARKLLGQSRTLHIVVGVVLFVLAFVHIGAALYYATFAR